VCNERLSVRQPNISFNPLLCFSFVCRLSSVSLTFPFPLSRFEPSERGLLSIATIPFTSGHFSPRYFRPSSRQKNCPSISSLLPDSDFGPALTGRRYRFFCTLRGRRKRKACGNNFPTPKESSFFLRATLYQVPSLVD